ncbi:MAG: ABC transporter ATP-binding protein/permease [Negativicutes bacterium]|nr:ABC transporter ATP-binding protein/permease [Negativicutes bacterium]
MAKINRGLVRRVWELTRAYWFSEEKWLARGLLTVIVTLNLAHVYILVLLTEWYNTFYNIIQSYEKDKFFGSLGEFSVLATANIIVVVYQIYLRQMLEIKWRRWMTERYLGAWLDDRKYYRMQLFDKRTDNPDQRISEDLRLFASSTLGLSLGLLKSVVTLGSFVFILWRLSGAFNLPLGAYTLSIPGYLVWFALGYAIVGTWLTHKIGKPLIGLNFDQQRYEADFRFSLVRLRENVESVAFYRGEEQEHAGFARRFSRVIANFRQLMQRQKQLTWFTAGYAQFAIIFPFLVAAPRYFSGEIKLGGLMQISSAFGRVQDALSFFVESYTQLAEWRAVVNRLVGFIENMEAVSEAAAALEEGIRVERVNDSVFSVRDLEIFLPDGERLLMPVNLELKAGDTLLIAGPSGAGKSTLLRAFAGLWPFGSGSVRIPRGDKTMFVPQKAYLPLGTLRETLLYPDGNGADDKEIKEIMSLVRLEWLADHLDRLEDWAHVLSLGEQQRIAFARVLLTKPQWLFLDEATSALDEATEKMLYKLLRDRLKDAAIISVGHRSTLNACHNIKLTLEGSEGKWRLLK